MPISSGSISQAADKAMRQTVIHHNQGLIIQTRFLSIREAVFRRSLRATSLFLLMLCWNPAIPALDANQDQYSHQVWQVEDGLPQNQIESILQTRDGYLWLTTREGLARFDGVRFVVFNRETTPGIESNIFYSLYEDDEGTLWIGAEDGLIRFKDGRFVTYTTKEGLYSEGIYQILEDGRGHLWFGSNRGIFQVSRQELNAFAEGQTKSISPTAYGKSDGLLRATGHFGTQPSGWRTRDGK